VLTTINLKPEENYNEEQSYYELIKGECDVFTMAYKNQLPVLLKVPTGCGETRFVKYVARKFKGIHACRITIYKEAADYLKHMYGPVNYSVIDNVRKLPLKVSDIYRKLTA
jgi:hypothetical protein